MADAELIVRVAGTADARTVWSWRNDVTTRAVSADPEVIAWSDHLQWFQQAVIDPDRHLLIASRGGDVGMVRFDRLATPGEWRVSINLAPHARGQSLGRKVLTRAERWLRSHDLVVRVEADVASTNVASARTFEAAGYCLLADSHGWRRYERVTSEAPPPTSSPSAGCPTSADRDRIDPSH